MSTHYQLRWPILVCGVAAVGTLLGSGCASAAQSSTQPSTEAAISASPQPVASVTAFDETATAAKLSTSASALLASASSGPGPATVTVTPPEVQVGSVVLSLAVQMPRHMLDQAAVVAGEAAQSPAPQPTAQARTVATRSEGSVVLSDMVRVTNNIDSTQPLLADAAQQILRHVVVQVRAAEAGAVVPYLGVSMDLLLDGRPVLNGQAVVPMVAVGADTPRLYYGNNIRLPQRGTYQVFMRMNRSPLLGPEQTPAAQFNLAVR